MLAKTFVTVILLVVMPGGVEPPDFELVPQAGSAKSHHDQAPFGFVGTWR
jgi:hypothetical protein